MRIEVLALKDGWLLFWVLECPTPAPVALAGEGVEDSRARG